MIAITTKLTEIYDQMLIKSNKLNDERNINNSEREGNKRVAADLTGREKEIKVLEEKYKGIKSVDDFKNQCEVLQGQVKDKRGVLHRDIALHEERVKKHEQEHSDAMSTVKDKEEKLRKAQKALDEEKKTYKDKVTTSIAVQLKAKGIDL